MSRHEKAISNQVDALIKRGKGKGKGKKGRKIGRYSKSPSCQRYRSEQRWAKNKVLRVRRHIKHYPDDQQARSWLLKLTGS